MNDVSLVNLDSKNIISVHLFCQTHDAKWLALEKIYQKLQRPNLYDIGGTYDRNASDFWFTCKTERLGDIFLLHIFVSNQKEGKYTVSLSYTGTNVGKDLKFITKSDIAYLPKILNNFAFHNKDNRIQYITTYSFTDLDVDMLKGCKLYIAVGFPPGYTKNILVNQFKLKHDFEALLHETIGADFTIESADGYKFHVHKLLLITRSEVFKAMLREETAESLNNYVKFIDIDTDHLQSILEFIYTGAVKKLDSSNCFNLLILADRFNLEGLRELTQLAVSNQISVDNVYELLAAADLYNSDLLKKKIFMFIKKHLSELHSNMYEEIDNQRLTKELNEYLVSIDKNKC